MATRCLVSTCSGRSSTRRATRSSSPRFHQWHAVRSLLEATYRDGAGADRLVQHSAGSGKSNTIAWTAHALSRLHGPDDAPIFDKVVVITDRKVLDRQLQDTVSGIEHTPGMIVRINEDSAQLKAALEARGASHHHDAAEVPGRRRAGSQGGVRGWWG